MFPQPAAAGYLSTTGSLVFKVAGRIQIAAATAGRAEERTIFTAPAGQVSILGVMPGSGGSLSAIQVYAKNLDTDRQKAGFQYGDIRIAPGVALTITSASLGPDSTGVGAPAVLPLNFHISSHTHTIGIDGSWSFNGGRSTLDASGNLILGGTAQATQIGLGVAPAAAVHIGVGGSLRYDNSAATHNFTNYYNAGLDRLDWAWDGTGVFTVDSTGAVIIAGTILAGGVITASSTITVQGASISVNGTTIAGTGNNAVMQRLAQVVCAGSQATVVFSSIPAGFTNLMIVFQSRDTLAGASISSVFLQMNADATAAHYDTSQQVGGVGTAASAAAVAPTTSGALAFSQPNDGSTAGLSSIGSILIPSYAGTTFFKQYTNTYQVINSTVTRSMVIVSAAWRQTTAITSLTFSTAGTAFKNGSTFTLYGMP